MSSQTRLRYLTRAGIIGALYAVLTVALAPISYGVYQVRVAEALTVLPLFAASAVPGLYVGCLVANIVGGMGWQDILFGALLTLVAAAVTGWIGAAYRTGTLSWKLALLLGPLPPVLFNAFGVSAYLAPILEMDYWFCVQMIGLGELVACYGLGIPLLLLLRPRRHWLES